MDIIDIEEEEIDAEILDAMSVRQAHFDDALKITNPSTLRETTVEVPNVKWEDIGGYDEVKQLLIQTIMYPITYPDVYLKYGQKPSRGALLWGPPGMWIDVYMNYLNLNVVFVYLPVFRLR